MSARLQHQPHCRWCGKAIAKSTTTHNISGVSWSSKKTFDAPLTLEDCRKMTNETVVSVKYHYETDTNYKKTGRRTVYSYNTWDGVSYVDMYFCNGEHAKAMGYGAARHGWSTVHFREAMSPYEAKEIYSGVFPSCTTEKEKA